ISVEMSQNTVSSAPLPWSLWLLLFLTPGTQTSSSAPETAAPPAVNVALLFDSGAPSHNLRNCSCSSPVQDCDEALANTLCRCHTVLRSALPPAGLGEPERLTVWVKELWVLQELLNRSRVGHLHLSFCGIDPMGSDYVALLGLRTLGIHSAAPGAPYPDQEMTIAPSAGVAAELEALSFDLSSSLHVTLLDLAVLNGLSALKAYTVVGPPARALAQNLPHLGLPPGAAETLLFTVVY
ncbi:exosomal polycystin-1-interacting protein-like, partial [Brachionichthys hirsutus]|uniref:exosomal polycystin-1-interacting protein-like n=1 Tax=Brachionichthys hirsutus TaxID=412623 RepID=UPI003604CC51